MKNLLLTAGCLVIAVASTSLALWYFSDQADRPGYMPAQHAEYGSQFDQTITSVDQFHVFEEHDTEIARVDRALSRIEVSKFTRTQPSNASHSTYNDTWFDEAIGDLSRELGRLESETAPGQKSEL